MESRTLQAASRETAAHLGRDRQRPQQICYREPHGCGHEGELLVWPPAGYIHRGDRRVIHCANCSCGATEQCTQQWCCWCC